jgi:hypothetical protein
MTYSAGSTITAADFNSFYGPTSAGGTSNANLGDIWGTGSGDKGWGQSLISNPAIGGPVTAVQWAALVANTATAGTQTSVSTASRTPAPSAGNTILAFTDFNANLSAINTARGNAAAQGTVYNTGGTGSVIAEAANTGGWNMTFTQTITFGSADQARYFWNAGGRAVITMSKTGTTYDKDADWNLFVSQVGTISFVGQVNSNSQSIAGVVYTGTSLNGTGSGTTPTVATTTGWYSLASGAAATQIYNKNEGVAPYTGDYIRVTAAVNAGRTAITFTTVWHDNGYSGAGRSNQTSAGGAVVLQYYPPSTTLTKTWGDPTISSSVA